MAEAILYGPDEINVQRKILFDEGDPIPTALFDAEGNPIRSLNGSLDIHDSDPHRNVYNQFLHFDTATTTTLSVAALAGENQLNFTSVVGFAIGNEIKLENGSLEPLFPIIRNIVGNLVDIDTPITFDHPIGADITKVHTNLATTGLTAGATRADPVIFTSHVPDSMVVHLTNMSVVMTHPSAMDFTKFGGAAALANGLVLRAKSGGFIGSYTNWKLNMDMDSDAFPIHYQSKSGGGEFGLSASYQIKTNTGAVVYMDGSLGDGFEALAQESLEVNTIIRLKLQGHYEGV